MNISAAHSYLVQPAKHVDPQPTVSGTAVPLRGALFDMLDELCRRAPTECQIEVVFRLDADGGQENKCRVALEAYLSDPSLENGRVIAQRLQRVTTKRSGLGLLFLAAGIIGDRELALVISRFPAEQGVVAQEDAERLDVEFIERVFMKNAKAYKSALYQTTSVAAGFQEGRAVDRQLSGPRELSQYWIGEFLESELRTTSAFGSRRLGEALRAAVNGTSDQMLKRELVSAASLLRNQHGRTRSARAFLTRLGVSEPAIRAIEGGFGRAELMDESFQFDREVFQEHVSYRMVELNTGAMLMADDDRFDEVFHIEPLVAEEQVRYTTEGTVVDQRYRKRK